MDLLVWVLSCPDHDSLQGYFVLPMSWAHLHVRNTRQYPVVATSDRQNLFQVSKVVQYVITFRVILKGRELEATYISLFLVRWVFSKRKFGNTKRKHHTMTAKSSSQHHS